MTLVEGRSGWQDITCGVAEDEESKYPGWSDMEDEILAKLT